MYPVLINMEYFIENSTSQSERVYIFQITDTCFGLIGPHQCDVEYPIYRKIPSATGDSNPGLTSESPVFYHYTDNSPVDKTRNIHEYPEN